MVELEESVNVLHFTMAYMKEHMFIPGRVENQHAILDMEFMGVTEIPRTWVKGAMASMAANIKCQGFLSYILQTVTAV